MTKVIEKFIKDMEIRNLRSGTQKNYLNAVHGLLRYYEETILEEITDEQVQDYLHYQLIERGHSKSHIRVLGAAFRFFFNSTLKKDPKKYLIPMTKRRKKLPALLSRQEVEKLFRTVGYDLRKTAFFAVLYGCGLRGSEACNLQVQDIERENRTLWVRDGKGGKDRGVYLPKSVYQALVRYWQACRFKDYLFVRPRNPVEPMRIQTAQGWFKLMKREVGIQKAGGLHLFRHSYATHALEDGDHLLTIKKNLGHTSLKTTMIYLQLAQLPNPQIAPIDRLFESMTQPTDQKW